MVHLKPSIGFIDMGRMGSHMAQRLLDAGYQLTVYDRTRERAEEVGQRGAQIAQTPRDLAAGCQIVMASVTDDRAQEEVMFGPDGALAGVHDEPYLLGENRKRRNQTSGPTTIQRRTTA
jgi:3-hydroxyisobutyrate dehydrogenase-like beta-hydroxyacid dehydrogenase